MALVAGIDGVVDVADLGQTQCCGTSLCEIDLCALMCNFINLLPNGPLWDKAKRDALTQLKECTDPNEFTACDNIPESCTSLVNHAIYSGKKLYHLLTQSLSPAIYESNPYTAYRTLDDWLDRLGWENCFEEACRSPLLGELTAVEIAGDCGPTFCQPSYPDELELAVKRGIVVALTRVNFGLIKNKSNINFVIEPLGAKIGNVPPTGTTDCCDIQIGVIPISDTIKKANPYYCHRNELVQQFIADQDMQAWVEAGTDCTGVIYASQPSATPRIYPGVLAAECIVRSLLSSTTDCHKITYSNLAV